MRGDRRAPEWLGLQEPDPAWLGPGAVVAALLAVAACSPDESGRGALHAAYDGTLDTPAEKASYGIGRDLAASVGGFVEEVDLGALMKGMEDALAGAAPPIPEHEIQHATDAFHAMVLAKRDSAAAAALDAGQAFLAENAQRHGIRTTASGLQYEILRPGEGAGPDAGGADAEHVLIHYRATLASGIEFESSHGGEPARFDLDRVIPGLAEAVRLIRVGGRIRAFLPPALAYGVEGFPPTVGPNEVLVFDVELIALHVPPPNAG